MPHARPADSKFLLCIKVKGAKVSRLRYRKAAGLERSNVISFLLIRLFYEIFFILKLSSAERRADNDASALRKRVVRSAGADSLRIKRVRKIKCPVPP